GAGGRPGRSARRQPGPGWRPGPGRLPGRGCLPGPGRRPARSKRPLAAAGLVAGALLAAGCGTAPARTFRPGSAVAGAAASSGPAAGPLAWPPFGQDVRIVMPGWLPRNGAEVPAVITAKDFLLAVLYAEYRGNQDDRWAGYAAGAARSTQRSILAQPDVTTESFTGTIIFSRLRAFPDPVVRGAVEVSECFDNAMSANTSLSAGTIIPSREPGDLHYYRNTDVVAAENGRWQVVSMYPVVYYPQAKECKP
ncbi:MAG: hypothetical protein ACHP9Z_22150, partial [Streptosporangiales bacterium]